MSENPKISICIPVYNVAEFLPRCLDSVVGQTLRDIEIICVNDGSTDASGAILQEFAAKDDRVKVISQENGGTHLARKRAVEAAKGDFITFLDSDDELELSACKTLLAKMQTEPCDILQFGVQCIFAQETEKYKSASLEKHFAPRRNPIFSSDEIIAKTILLSPHQKNLVAHLFRAEIAKKAFAASSDEKICVTEDGYEKLLISHFAKTHRGTAEKFYKYNVGIGITKNSYDEQKLRKIASSAFFISASLEKFAAEYGASKTFLKAKSFLENSIATFYAGDFALFWKQIWRAQWRGAENSAVLKSAEEKFVNVNSKIYKIGRALVAPLIALKKLLR